MTEELPEEQFEVEYTTRLDYINAAVLSLTSIGDIDAMIMNKSDEQRIKRIRRKSLRIIDECLCEMYDELFETDDEDKTD
jgi:hypothetical protein